MIFLSPRSTIILKDCITLKTERYDKLCEDKGTKIHMPKMKIDEDTGIVTFSDGQMIALSRYFKDKNAETAFMLGEYWGLCINGCYGSKVRMTGWPFHRDKEEYFRNAQNGSPNYSKYP